MPEPFPVDMMKGCLTLMFFLGIVVVFILFILK